MRIFHSKKKDKPKTVETIMRLVKEFLIPGIKAEVGITAVEYLERLQRLEQVVSDLSVMAGREIFSGEKR